MWRITFLGVSALALLSTLAPVPAWAQEAGSWTVCKAEGIAVRTSHGVRDTYYLSGAVTSPKDQGFVKAFARYIEVKHLEGKTMRDLPSCWTAVSEAEAQGSIEKKVGSSRWNITYIATGWTNTPAIPATDAMLQGPPAESP